MTTDLVEHERDLESVFRALADDWKSRKSHSSSVEEMAMHPAYQQIIGLGPDVVPLLLAELERHPDHWFWALHAVTREDPVPPESRGKIRAMAKAWIEWGRRNVHRLNAMAKHVRQPSSLCRGDCTQERV